MPEPKSKLSFCNPRLAYLLVLFSFILLFSHHQTAMEPKKGFECSLKLRDFCLVWESGEALEVVCAWTPRENCRQDPSFRGSKAGLGRPLSREIGVVSRLSSGSLAGSRGEEQG